jgi:hypothetical protein
MNPGRITTTSVSGVIVRAAYRFGWVGASTTVDPPGARRSHLSAGIREADQQRRQRR